MKTTITALSVAAALFAHTTANAQLNLGATASATLKTTAHINSGAMNKSLHTTGSRLQSAGNQTVNAAKETEASARSSAKKSAYEVSETSNNARNNTSATVHSSNRINSAPVVSSIRNVQADEGSTARSSASFDVDAEENFTPAVRHKARTSHEKASKKYTDLSGNTKEKTAQAVNKIEQKGGSISTEVNSSTDVKTASKIRGSEQ